ncbi:hypothetical protein CspHIS471_0302430 [Cutaneotrichosporon sp. HIS471]|nr:hypothetical protein CspHIS471_0302430 [Cutaneotrichosporon sp. HIS471]
MSSALAPTLLSRSFAAARQTLVRAPRPVVPSAYVTSRIASPTRWYSSPPNPDSPALGAPEKEVEGGSTGKQPIGKIEPRLSLTFTCQAGPEKGNPVCGHRSTHEFKRHSYDKGVVLIQCPECKARHLIADHLGWFNEVTGDGKHKTVEDLVKAKGEKVTRGRVNLDGDIEYAPE